MPELNDVLEAWKARNWILVAALVVGAVVRLLKSDTKIPIDLPPEWRPRVAMGLGIVAGVLLMVTRGMSWKSAALSGITAGFAAILGHEWLVERLIGKDIPIPGLMKSPDSPKPPPG